jgi:signal recognition particle GTPase
MSEHEERPYSGIEEQVEGGLQEPAEASADEGMGAMHETGLASEEEQRERLAEKMPEHEAEEEEEEEKENAKRTQKKKKTPKSKRKEQEYSITDIGKQIEKQTNYLARLEQILQPLRKLVKSSDVQSKLVKDINASVKQMERQIIQIQKSIQKGKTRKK